MKRRLISVFLVFCILLTLFPAAFAWEAAFVETWEAVPDTGSSETSAESEGSLLAGDIIASGECGRDGDNVTWTLDSAGTLIISGTGAMKSYALYTEPWRNRKDDIKTILIQKGVTYIGNGSTFSYCKFLTSVTIPDSVTEIGSQAFEGCSGLTEVIIPDGVTEIGWSAFEGCSNLTTITIPDSVTKIWENAFPRCGKLKNVIVDSANANYTSQDGVLFNKEKTTLCTFPAGKTVTTYNIPNSVTEITRKAFEGCSGLTSVTIPNSVTEIGSEAFMECSGLTSVTIPNSVTEIGEDAFRGCSNLVSVTISNNVTVVNGGVFEDCSSLTSVTIPNSVEVLDFAVFYRCDALKSVIIPVSVGYISDFVFQECKNLKDVYYAGSAEQWKTIFIGGANTSLEDAVVHYNSTGGGGNNLPEIQTSGYYKTPESRLFRVRAKDISYPMPAGFVIAANGQTFSTGNATCTSTDDIHVTVPGDYGGDFLITKVGYHDCALPAALTGEYNSVVMTPVSVTAPFVQALLLDHTQGAYTRYYNLLSEAGNVFELDISGKEQTEMSALYPAVNWNGHGAGQIWLEQGEVRIALNNNALNEVCLPEKFTASADIYLCGEAADGATFRQKTKLRILKRFSSELPLDFGESIQIDLNEADNENADILWQSGEKLEIDFGKLLDTFPISFNIKEDGTVEGVLGIELPEKGVTQGVYGAMKGSLARLAALEGDDVAQSEQVASLAKELKKNGVFLMESVNTFGIKAKYGFWGILPEKLSTAHLRLQSLGLP